MDRPENGEQASANYDAARKDLLAFLSGNENGKSLVDNVPEFAIAFLSGKAALLQLATLEWAMLEARDLKQAAREYVDGARENAAAAREARDAADTNATSMKRLTAAIVGAAFVQAAAAVAQWLHPAAAPAPIVNVAPPAVHVAGPTINLPPQPQRQDRAAPGKHP